jgi:Bacterial Ig domain
MSRIALLGVFSMQSKAVTLIFLSNFAIVLSVTMASAACKIEAWKFRWGPAPTPVSITVTDGSTCGSNISLSGAEKLTGVAVLSQGSTGAVSTTENRFQYRPKAGFKGSDKFTVQLRGTDRLGAAVTNDLNVSVTVQ